MDAIKDKIIHPEGLEIKENKSHTKRSSKEHVLIKVWVNREKELNSLEQLTSRVKEDKPELLVGELVHDGFLNLESGKVTFTDEGEKYAENLMRRHRLAEVLFSEILDMDDFSAHSQACEFEHVLTTEVADSICTFLGHPLNCPHDMPIPRGKCCSTFQKKVTPLIKPLIDLKIGEEGKIVFMTPKTNLRLDRLMTFGITPGSIIKLHQRKPSIVLQIGETDLALDYDIAKHIYVKQVNGDSNQS